jgi:HSP20 family molecular chaperone IbpA
VPFNKTEREQMSPSSSAQQNNDNGGDDRPATASHSSASWFGSWFDNHSTDMRKEIHEKLDDYEKEKKRYEDQMMHLQQQQQQQGGLFGRRMPFFPWFGSFDNVGSWDSHHRQQDKDMQEFFQRFQDELMSSPLSSTSSSSRRVFSSGTSVSIRESSLDGAQIDVQLPRGSSMDDVAVDVVQEYPCVVQYRIANGEKEKGFQPLQNQVRLGEYIDCSKVSASVSSARNILTVKAPVQKSDKTEERKVRTVLVTENDSMN